MKVFLAGIIQGSLATADIHQQDWRDPIRRVIESTFPAAEIYCHYSQHPNSITYDLPEIRKTFVQGLSRCIDADLTIAYLPSASMGTAIEIYEAYRHGKIVLTVTPMDANWVVRLYSHRIFPTVDALEAFLVTDEAKALLQR
ncbi:MAG: hypothetical protein HN909_05520 [Phycisphaerales bacterium]|jgi:hypothetical protein|nr:hypothetical protein [Phycisphaerales bacterium]MBT7171213.1 hypothetical protein [Phycisphaerales bacterium]